MHSPPGRGTRAARLAALGASLAIVATASSAAGMALADTADTGGTATIALSTRYLEALAKAGVILIPAAPASSSYASGADAYTFSVTGGNGDVNNFVGSVDLGGQLRVVNARNGRTVILTSLRFSFDNGNLTGTLSGTKTKVVLADIGGDLSEADNAGPPKTETFSSDQFTVDRSAARRFDAALGTTAFRAGADMGGFTTTFDVTTS